MFWFRPCSKPPLRGPSARFQRPVPTSNPDKQSPRQSPARLRPTTRIGNAPARPSAAFLDTLRPDHCRYSSNVLAASKTFAMDVTSMDVLSTSSMSTTRSTSATLSTNVVGVAPATTTTQRSATSGPLALLITTGFNRLPVRAGQHRADPAADPAFQDKVLVGLRLTGDVTRLQSPEKLIVVLQMKRLEEQLAGPASPRRSDRFADVRLAFLAPQGEQRLVFGHAEESSEVPQFVQRLLREAAPLARSGPALPCRLGPILDSYTLTSSALRRTPHWYRDLGAGKTQSQEQELLKRS